MTTRVNMVPVKHILAPILLLAMASCAYCFKFSRCGGNNDINVQNISIEPNILNLPGKVKLAFAGKIERPFQNIDLKLGVVRKTWLVNIRIPCLLNIGSCTYPDLCNLLDRMERENWAGISARIAAEIRRLTADIDMDGLSSCPFEPAELAISGREMSLPEIPSLLAMIASGEYVIRVELSNRDTQELMTCFEMELTMKKAN